MESVAQHRGKSFPSGLSLEYIIFLGFCRLLPHSPIPPSDPGIPSQHYSNNFSMIRSFCQKVVNNFSFVVWEKYKLLPWGFFPSLERYSHLFKMSRERRIARASFSLFHHLIKNPTVQLSVNPEKSQNFKKPKQLNFHGPFSLPSHLPWISKDTNKGLRCVMHKAKLLLQFLVTFSSQSPTG